MEHSQEKQLFSFEVSTLRKQSCDPSPRCLGGDNVLAHIGLVAVPVCFLFRYTSGLTPGNRPTERFSLPLKIERQPPVYVESFFVQSMRQ